MGKLTALHIVEDPAEAQVAMLVLLPNYFKSPLIWPKYAKKSWGRPAKPRRAPFLHILNPLMASAYIERYGHITVNPKGQIIGTPSSHPPLPLYTIVQIGYVSINLQ